MLGFEVQAGCCGLGLPSPPLTRILAALAAMRSALWRSYSLI